MFGERSKMCTKQRENSLSDCKEAILEQLDRIGKSRCYVWRMVLLCLTPSIFNGFHASSYIFLTQVPSNISCTNSYLKDLTPEEVQSITGSNDCSIINWNYKSFSNKTYDQIIESINSTTPPITVKCGTHGSQFVYDMPAGHSTVTEWDLVCDRKLYRTNIQMALAVGKFSGAFIVGVIADRYGRKTGVAMSIILYIVAGPLSFLTPWYWGFFISRYLLGVAGAGVYHSAYTILTEVVPNDSRAWVSNIFSLAYPIGSSLLAIIAYYVRDWRHLQAALTLPTIFLILNILYLDESPRWLLSKGRISDAHKIVFKKSETNFMKVDILAGQPLLDEPPKTLNQKISSALHEMSTLYGTNIMRNRLLICQFCWFVVSFAYYAIALNAENISVSSYEYILLMGLLELPSCFITIGILKYFGRRITSFITFTLSGVSLLAILGLPQGATEGIMTVALFGRFFIASAFIVVILHTAEIFPTEIRSTAIGSSSMMAHIGTISAPYVVDILGHVGYYIPTTICAVLAIAAGILVMFLPETKNELLLDKVEEVEGV